MKRVVLFAVSALLIGSCSSEPKEVLLKTEKAKKEVKVPVHANKQLTMQIEGMTCVMGCGGSIRKELRATGGVDKVDYDFEEGRKVQTATITYDTTKVSTEEMIHIVNTINDKQYKVLKSKSSDLAVSTGVNSTATSKAEEEEMVSMKEELVQLPNLIDILTSFLK